jgi:hypothetical protein
MLIQAADEEGVTPYMRDELVKLGLSNKVFEVEEEVKALLIRNARESIVGILALKINNELGELMVISKVINGISQRFPSNNGREVAVGFAVNSSQNSPLEVNGPAFIQPEMLPRAVGDQVTTPAVSQLVRNNIDVFAILEILSVGCR